MDLASAKEVLAAAIKVESFNPELDSYYVQWFEPNGGELATGYFAREIIRSVWFYTGKKFEGEEADQLRLCFASELVGSESSP